MDFGLEMEFSGQLTLGSYRFKILYILLRAYGNQNKLYAETAPSNIIDCLRDPRCTPTDFFFLIVHSNSFSCELPSVLVTAAVCIDLYRAVFACLFSLQLQYISYAYKLAI
jgi:hypothetical protein